MKILIADDEAVSRKKMQLLLKSLGECEPVKTGVAAVNAFKKSLEKERPFDLITLDISMPDMDGITALTEIRAAEKSNWIKTGRKQEPVKIIMVTSYARKELVVGCARAGSDGYIVKPFDREVIVEKLKAMGFNQS